jgi:mono/diheme cytochrome c family protein
MQRALAVALVFFSLSLPAQAQDQGDAKKGLKLAQGVCAECHAIRGQGRSPEKEAPSFVKLANTPGVNAMALYVALQTSHKQMPNLTLPRNERDDVVAYILSLKQRN